MVYYWSWIDGKAIPINKNIVVFLSSRWKKAIDHIILTAKQDSNTKYYLEINISAQ